MIERAGRPEQRSSRNSHLRRRSAVRQRTTAERSCRHCRGRRRKGRRDARSGEIRARTCPRPVRKRHRCVREGRTAEESETPKPETRFSNPRLAREGTRGLFLRPSLDGMKKRGNGSVSHTFLGVNMLRVLNFSSLSCQNTKRRFIRSEAADRGSAPSALAPR